MSIKNILIASVLKPANDTRMLNKMAISLAALDGFQVHVFGSSPDTIQTYSSNNPHPNIELHSHSIVKRNLVGRLKACWKFYIITLKLKPELTIINSADIQLIMCFFKIFYGLKYLYDVRENYFLNIRYQSTYPRVFRWILSLIIRLIERVGFIYASGSIVAEICYVKQIQFLAKKPILIALNKSQPLNPNQKPMPNTRPTPDDIRCLFSGYLSSESGVFTAIDWCIEWQKKYSCLRLHIIGYAPKISTQNRLYALEQQYSWIRLTGIDTLVDHNHIDQAIKESNIGILSYRISKANIDKTPTKYFEYCSNQMYMICTEDNYHLLNLANKTNIYLVKDFDKMLNISSISNNNISNNNANYWNANYFSDYVLGFC